MSVILTTTFPAPRADYVTITADLTGMDYTQRVEEIDQFFNAINTLRSKIWSIEDADKALKARTTTRAQSDVIIPQVGFASDENQGEEAITS